MSNEISDTTVVVENESPTESQQYEQQYEYAPDPKLENSKRTYKWFFRNPFFNWREHYESLKEPIGCVFTWMTYPELTQLRCLCHALGLTRSQFIRMAIMDKLSTDLQDSETLQKYTDMWSILHKADIERAERAAAKREEKLQRKIVNDLNVQRAQERKAAKLAEKEQKALQIAAQKLKSIAGKLGYKTRPTNVAQIIDTTVTEAPQVTPENSVEILKSSKQIRGRVIKRV